MQEHARFYFWLTAATITIATLYRLSVAMWGHYPLAGEEMQYWDWSRRLDWSYYSKPPMIAYMIRASTEIFGSTVFGVRFVAVVCSFLTGLLAWGFTHTLFRSPRISFFSVLFLSIMPLYAVGALVLTTDTPLMLFWAACCWALWLAVSKDRLSLWILAGVFFGLGILSKYAMVYIILGLALFLILSPKHRYLLRSAGPYAFLVVGTFFFLPVVYWNYLNDWVSFKHVAGNAGVDKGFQIRPDFFFSYLGAQAGLANPFIFIAGWIFVFRSVRRRELTADPRLLFLLCIGLSVFLLLLIKSIQDRVLDNWAAPAYFTFTIYTAAVVTRWVEEQGGFSQLSGKLQKALYASIAVPIFFNIALYERPIFVAAHRVVESFGITVPSKVDPGHQFFGLREMGELATIYRAKMPNPEQTFVFAHNYQHTAALAFWTEGQPRAYCINRGRRMNQYDVWGGFDELVGWDAIYIVRGNERVLRETTASAFARHEGPFQYELQIFGRRYFLFSVFMLYDFVGEFPVVERGGFAF